MLRPFSSPRLAAPLVAPPVAPLAIQFAALFVALLALAGCARLPTPPIQRAPADAPAPGTANCPPAATAPTITATCPVCAPCAVCPVCPEAPKPEVPAAKPLAPATWEDLPGWREDNLAPAFEALLTGCARLTRQPLWQPVCAAAAEVSDRQPAAVRAWFEARFQPWALVNPDGSREGLVTGYYEPILKGSRQRSTRYPYPLYGPPDDLIVVDLAELHPELKHLRLRGRLEGRKLVPYYSRAEWSEQESKRSPKALIWIDDAIDLFFMQIQGSGQIQLADGSRVRINYADQNGHPYRSIGRWLLDQGELEPGQASMQGIKAWARAHPQRLTELLNTNPSLVFFRELPAEAMAAPGPIGALGVPLTPERSIAIDPRTIPLGAPVYLATTRPNSEQALTRLMLAQDTGGAIRGVVRADFYWGSGGDAGSQAGRMRQPGRMWLLLPRGHVPDNAAP